MALHPLYFRVSAGAACGPGDQESLSPTAGTSVQTKALDGTGDTWNRTETARSVAAGNWRVFFRCVTGSGGGPGNQVTVLVERRNSSCVVQETIINEAIDTTKGATETLSTAATAASQIDFTAGDILTVVMTDSSGNQTKTLRYDDASPDECYLLSPDEVSGRRIMVIH